MSTEPQTLNDIISGASSGPIGRSEVLANSSPSIIDAIRRTWRGDDNIQAANARRSSMMMYWKKCERQRCPRHSNPRTGENSEAGWIVVGPSQVTDPMEYSRWINERHMTPLPQYGLVPYGMEGAANPDRRFDAILSHPGGIYEFPISQIVAYNWDLIPEVQEVRPELANVKRYKCTVGGCYDRRFPSEKALEQHIRAVHEDAVATRAMGSVLESAFERSHRAAVNPDAIASAVAASVAEVIPLVAKMMAEAVSEQKRQSAGAPPPVDHVPPEDQEIPDVQLDLGQSARRGRFRS